MENITLLEDEIVKDFVGEYDPEHYLLKDGESMIDAALMQELTTSMRIDLFYQTAECRLEPDGNGVRAILSAGNRKSVQLHAGARYDIEEYAAVQLGLDIPLKTAIPISTDITLRLNASRRIYA